MGRAPGAQTDGVGVGLDAAPGVSVAATSSARWRRLLEAGSREVHGADLEEARRSRTITFVVGATADRAWFDRARIAGTAFAEHGGGTVVELEDTASPGSQARIRRALAEARTGWRFRVVGDEPALGALRAMLHDAGVLDEEIALVLASPASAAGKFLVYCGHCHSKTLASGVATVACSGCGLGLTVYVHFSRRQAAYLGYFADAELGAPAQPARERSQLALA